MQTRLLAENYMHSRVCPLFLAIKLFSIKFLVSNSFICGKFNYCPLIWMFSSIRSYHKINKLHERSLQICQNDYTSNYDKQWSKEA